MRHAIGLGGFGPDRSGVIVRRRQARIEVWASRDGRHKYRENPIIFSIAFSFTINCYLRSTLDDLLILSPIDTYVFRLHRVLHLLLAFPFFASHSSFAQPLTIDIRPLARRVIRRVTHEEVCASDSSALFLGLPNTLQILSFLPLVPYAEESFTYQGSCISLFAFIDASDPSFLSESHVRGRVSPIKVFASDSKHHSCL